MEQQISIKTNNMIEVITITLKTLAVAALMVFGAMALQRGFARVSTAVENAWTTDSSWTMKGGWR